MTLNQPLLATLSKSRTIWHQKKGYIEGWDWVGTALKKKRKSITNKIVISKILHWSLYSQWKKSAQPGFEPGTYRMQNQSANHYTMVPLLTNDKVLHDRLGINSVNDRRMSSYPLISAQCGPRGKFLIDFFCSNEKWSPSLFYLSFLLVHELIRCLRFKPFLTPCAYNFQ